MYRIIHCLYLLKLTVSPIDFRFDSTAFTDKKWEVRIVFFQTDVMSFNKIPEKKF